MKKYYWIIIKAICEVGVFPQTNEIKTHTTMNQLDRLGSRSHLDCLILMIFAEIEKTLDKQAVELLEYISLKDRLIDKISQKDLIKKSIKTPVGPWLLFDCVGLIAVFCFFLFGSKNQEIIFDEHHTKVLSLTIDEKKLSDQKKQSMLLKKFLVVKNNGFFVLFKKSGEPKNNKQTYHFQGCKLFDLLFNKSPVEEKKKILNYLTAMKFCEKAGSLFSKPIHHTLKIEFVDWELIREKSKDKWFFYTQEQEKKTKLIKYNQDCNSFKETQTKEEREQIEEIESSKVIKKYFKKIASFYSSILFDIQEQETLASFMEELVKNAPNLDEIKNSIKYRFDFGTNKIFLVLMKEKEIYLEKQPIKSKILKFFFQDQDLIRELPKITQKKIFFINLIKYEEIKKLAEKYCLVSYNAAEGDITKETYCIIFFDKTLDFQRYYFDGDNYSFNKIQHLNPLIIKENLKNFIMQVLKSRPSVLLASCIDKNSEISWENFFITSIKTYPTKEEIQKCVLSKEKKLCIPTGYFSNQAKRMLYESNLSLFLNHFFENTETLCQIDFKLKIIAEERETERKKKTIKHKVIQNLQQKLKNCFYLYENQNNGQCLKNYQDSSAIWSFESRIKSAEINLDLGEKQNFWQYLLERQEEKIKEGIQINFPMFWNKAVESYVTIKELEKTIPDCFLTDIKKLYAEYQKGKSLKQTI